MAAPHRPTIIIHVHGPQVTSGSPALESMLQPTTWSPTDGVAPIGSWPTNRQRQHRKTFGATAAHLENCHLLQLEEGRLGDVVSVVDIEPVAAVLHSDRRVEWTSFRMAYAEAATEHVLPIERTTVSTGCVFHFPLSLMLDWNIDAFGQIEHYLK